MYGKKYWGIERSTFVIDQADRPCTAMWMKCWLPSKRDLFLLVLYAAVRPMSAPLRRARAFHHPPLRRSREGIGILLDEQLSPTRDRMLRSLKEQFPQIKFYSYEPLSFEERDSAIASLFGPDVAIKPAFANADIIVSLDCDFLGSEQTLQGVRDFSRRRRVNGSSRPNEPALCGRESFHRRPAGWPITVFVVRPLRSPPLRCSWRKRSPDPPTTEFWEVWLPNSVIPAANSTMLWLTECANDLVAKKGQSLVLASNRFPAWVHSVVLAMNSALGAFGSTLEILSVPRVKTANLGDLVADAKSHPLKKLFILGGNPVYTAPADLDWAGVQRSIPGSHQARVSDGRDLRRGKLACAGSPFSRILGRPASRGRDLSANPADDSSVVRRALPNRYPIQTGCSSQRRPGRSRHLQILYQRDRFRVCLDEISPERLCGTTVYETAKVDLNPNALPELLKTAGPLSGPVTPSSIEVVFPADYKVYDGRYANNAWLQELPDPITKLTWDNAVLFSKSTAKALQVDDGDIVEISVEERKLQAPVMIAPGHADYSLSLSLGYGRWEVGNVGRGTGFNANLLRTTALPTMRQVRP